jgi:hypothetical protein
MGVIQRRVPFTGAVPPIATIVTRLCQLVAEEVYYDQHLRELRCPVIQTDCSLYLVQQNEYLISSYHFAPTYLVEATLVVLHTLGGTVSQPLPIWASQPWQLAKKYYEA